MRAPRRRWLRNSKTSRLEAGLGFEPSFVANLEPSFEVNLNVSARDRAGLRYCKIVHKGKALIRRRIQRSCHWDFLPRRCRHLRHGTVRHLGKLLRQAPRLE